jgi:predicted nucleic acid-binding Zn finger protein
VFELQKSVGKTSLVGVYNLVVGVEQKLKMSLNFCMCCTVCKGVQKGGQLQAHYVTMISEIG